MSGMKVFMAIIAVIIIAVVAAALAMYFRLIPIPAPILSLLVSTKPPEYSARYYPPDTLVYSWLTLVPGEDQIVDMQDIWGRLNAYPGFDDLIQEWKTTFLLATGTDFDTDILPWIGPEISAGLIDFNPTTGPPILAVTVEVRDEDAAERFLDKWRQYRVEESGADFDSSSHRGAKTWADGESNQFYALTGDWLVYTNDEALLVSVLDRMSGADDVSLAETANFVGAGAALPERRFHSVYVNYRKALDTFDDLTHVFGPIVPGVIGPATFAEQSPDWVAVSVSWVDRGLVAEIMSPTVSDPGPPPDEMDDPARLLPEDTLGFMAAGFDPNIDNWRKALAEYQLLEVVPDPSIIDQINATAESMMPGSGQALSRDATAADALDLGLVLAMQFTGVDLEADFFRHLSGEMIVAVREFDIEAVSDNPTANAVDAAVLLSYQEDAQEPLEETMAAVGGLLTDFAGLVPESVDVGAETDATVFDASQFGVMLGGEIGYMPGYVLHDQYLTIGTTPQALSMIVNQQRGEATSLWSDPEYQRATDYLDANRQFVGYIDVSAIVNQLDAEDFQLEPDRFQVIREGLGVVAFGSFTGTDYARTVATLTLFPE